MAWLYFLLALVALVVAFQSTSMALLLACLLATLVLTLAGIMRLLADRIGSRSRDAALVLDPEELRRMREQADARKAVQSPPADSSGPTGSTS